MKPFDHRALDTVIHSRIRLSIVALLASVDDAEFTHIRDQVETTDGNLGNHLGRLTEAGYVEGARDLDDGRALTRYRLTDKGREAFADYVEQLEAILRPDGPASGPPAVDSTPTEATP